MSTTSLIRDFIDFLQSLKQQHYVNYDDCWYSCPLADSEKEGYCCDPEAVKKGECTCGADTFNKRIDTKVESLYEHPSFPSNT